MSILLSIFLGWTAYSARITCPKTAGPTATESTGTPCPLVIGDSGCTLFVGKKIDCSDHLLEGIRTPCFFFKLETENLKLIHLTTITPFMMIQWPGKVQRYG